MDILNRWLWNIVSIHISGAEIPERSEKDELVPIFVEGYAPNGCYSNIEFQLIRKADFHYLLVGEASVRSNGTCSQEIIMSDSTIEFISSMPGTYFFQINEPPFKILNDTLIIN